MTRLLLLFILFSTTLTTFCQYRIGLVPRVSPDKYVYQKVGYTEVELTYGSPSVNSRLVWGNLAPYNKVWRAGANNATTVRFGLPVVIDGIALDSGIYALFVMPKKDDKWTVILSNKSNQWGSFRYDEADDALRTDIIPRRSNQYREELEYSIGQTGFQYGSIILAWEHLEIEIPFETNYLDEFKNAVIQSIEQYPEMER